MKEKSTTFIIVLLSFSFFPLFAFSQVDGDTLQSKRLAWTGASLGVGYGTSTFLLNEAWYKGYPRSSFHLFNDWGEWSNIDKVGHVFSSQFQSNYAYNLYRWAGLHDDDAILYGSLTALLFQSTIEVLDGFSSEWGFSMYDFSANLLGVSLFAAQQSRWGRQKIILKVSGGVKNYNSATLENGEIISLDERADELFGSSLPSRFLKDYNAQTYWISINAQDITKINVPTWLNVSFGYGVENHFGGYTNSWDDNDRQLVLPSIEHPRIHQFYFSPDFDLTKIQTKSPFLKTVLGILNIFKFPLPALEINSQGDLNFHFLKF